VSVAESFIIKQSFAAVTGLDWRQGMKMAGQFSRDANSL